MDGNIPVWDAAHDVDPMSAHWVRLSEASKGDRGVVMRVACDALSPDGGVEQAELERRLLEIGFVEGAKVELLHEGFIGRDPIAVKLDDMRVALRRREARGILLALDSTFKSARKTKPVR